MADNRKILTRRLCTDKGGAKELQHTKVRALLSLSLMIMVGLFTLSPILSSSINNAIIKSSGRISANAVVAKSGYWKDIQDAVNTVVAAGGVGNVYIPEGTWNFVSVGESWSGARVTVPAGVSLFGAPTQRTTGLPYNGVGQNPNGQVVEWKTILRLPWDVPGSWYGGNGDPPQYGGPKTPFWFKIVGNGNPNEPSRFSDIKLVGYRSIDSDSKMIVGAIMINDVVNFRVDHCSFEHTSGGGVSAEGSNSGKISGVVDHCPIYNIYGVTGDPWYLNTVGYGVMVYRDYGGLWEEDINDVLGHYNDYSVYIEDCYLSKWRHNVASNTGAHYVFRHNTIYNDFGHGSLDAHGWFASTCNNPSHGEITNPEATWNGTDWVCSLCGAPLRSTNAESYFYIAQVGTRAAEFYNNNITYAISEGVALAIRGGGGVCFGNSIGYGTYRAVFYFFNDAQAHPEGSKVWINDWYIWGNIYPANVTLITKYDPYGDITENANYFLRAPNITLDGWEYTPYAYPHQLTLEGSLP